VNGRQHDDGPARYPAQDIHGRLLFPGATRFPATPQTHPPGGLKGWNRIAVALGVSRQAARYRFASKVG
jgi:hypothetical protein